MPFEDVNSALEPLMFQMKQYKNLTKSTIEILPSSGQTNYGPHQKCIFTLPYASLLSLEDLALHFDFQPTNVPSVTKADHGTFDAQRVIAPKDVASLIAEIDIKINGQTIQHLTNYNDIVNIMNMFQDPKSAKKVLQGCDPRNFSWVDTTGDYDSTDSTEYLQVSGWIAASPDNGMKKPVRYAINHWYGLLGARGKEVSSNFIDTNMVGEVTIAFTFATPAVLIGTKPTAANLQAILAKSSGTGVEASDITTDYDASTASYTLSDLKMSMVRYNLPMEYSEALRSNLSSGAKYQIAFNHYEIHSQSANSNSGSIRFNENSKDIKGLIAYFTNADRDNSQKPSEYDPLINTSEYFKYDNPAHKSSQFQVGSVLMPQNELKSEEAFLELTRAVSGARGNNAEFDSNIKTIGQWLSSYFMAYPSLEMTEGMTLVANDNKKLLSGLSSENFPISCVYKYSNDSVIATRYTWGTTKHKNINVMALTTRMLVIENGQNCYVEI